MSTHHDRERARNGPLTSLFVDDPAMTDLVRFFLDELPRRVDDIRRACDEDDLAIARRLAHQLKGAAGGYGYPEITAAAASLERLTLADEAQMSALAEQIDALSQLCDRAQLARPGDRAA